MHRSGTSALSGSLEQAGVYLGEVNEHSVDNVKGNKESQAIMTLNEDLLNRSGGSWHAPPDKIQWSALHKLTRDLIVNQFNSHVLWGFKDPRTVLILDGWMRALTNAQLVGIFRHPFLVAESLFKRNAIQYEKGLELWIRYNRVLKWQLENNSTSGHLLEFSVSSEEYKNQLVSLLKTLKLSTSGQDFFNPALKNSVIPDLGYCEYAAEALSVYQNLQNLNVARSQA